MPRVGQGDGELALDPAGPRRQHRHAVGHEDRLVDVVGHEQHRLAVGFPDPQQQLLHQRPGLVVERAERLVEQEDLGVVGQRAGQGRALLHAAGQRARIVMLEAARARRARCSWAATRACSPAAMPFSRNPKRMFSLDGQPGEERVGLKDHAAVGAGAAHRRAVDEDPTRGRLIEAGDDAQQRRLAAARGPQQDQEIVVVDDQRRRLERARRRAAAADRRTCG